MFNALLGCKQLRKSLLKSWISQLLKRMLRLIFSLLWYRRKMTISQERVWICHVGIKAKIFSWKFFLYLHRTRNFQFQSIHELWAILWDLVYKLLNAWDFEVPCLMPRKGDIPGEKLCFYDLVKNLYSFLRYGQFHECTREGKRPIAASSSVLEKSMWRGWCEYLFL